MLRGTEAMLQGGRRWRSGPEKPAEVHARSEAADPRRVAAGGGRCQWILEHGSAGGRWLPARGREASISVTGKGGSRGRRREGRK